MMERDELARLLQGVNLGDDDVVKVPPVEVVVEMLCKRMGVTSSTEVVGPPAGALEYIMTITEHMMKSVITRQHAERATIENYPDILMQFIGELASTMFALGVLFSEQGWDTQAQIYTSEE